MRTADRGVPVESVAAVVALALLSLGTALRRAGRLTYHEAIVAQGAREMLATGDLLVPTIGGRPWLEKPPLVHWLGAPAGGAAGGGGEAGAPRAAGGGGGGMGRRGRGRGRGPRAVGGGGDGVGHRGGTAGLATVRTGDWAPGRRRAGDRGLGGDARAPGRGRHPPGLPGLLGGGGLRRRAHE